MIVDNIVKIFFPEDIIFVSFGSLVSSICLTVSTMLMGLTRLVIYKKSAKSQYFQQNVLLKGPKHLSEITFSYLLLNTYYKQMKQLKASKQPIYMLPLQLNLLIVLYLIWWNQRFLKYYVLDDTGMMVSCYGVVLKKN